MPAWRADSSCSSERTKTERWDSGNFGASKRGSIALKAIFGAVSRGVWLTFSTNSRRMRLISEMGRMTSSSMRDSSERRWNPVPPSFPN